MTFLRNPEVRKTLAVYVAVSLGAVVAAWLWAPGFGLFTLALSLVLTAIYLVSTHGRYQRISQLAARIDGLLHGSIPAETPYAEGELALLQCEIAKMTVRLREQQQHLQEDKIYLADSIADISHQIRTPLTSINLLVSLLAEPELAPQRKAQLLRELMQQLSRIDWLITTLLKMSKLDAGTIQLRRETLPLETLLHRSVESLLIPMELREQALEIQAEGSFRGDPAWTCEALSNIVKNCMEHTPQGGTVRICAAENPLYAEITVSDTGSGIPKEDLPHIFERFYKGKDSSGQSFGIGLSLARSIIKQQNGTIKAENCPEGGARFTIRFYKGTV